MKIEKINENQVKFFLNREDLIERNLDLNELTHGSEKAQALFREIMERALEQCGFQSDDVPLMIEAVPASNDSMIIIVSKVSEKGERDRSFSFAPFSKDTKKYKKRPLAEYKSEDNAIDARISIYGFESLDDVISAAERLYDACGKLNSLYKYEEKYFLVTQLDSFSKMDSEQMDSLFSEYGEKYVSNIISKYHIIEYGEAIIKEDALNILNSIG